MATDFSLLEIERALIVEIQGLITLENKSKAK
jgi:hypothetical protein